MRCATGRHSTGRDRNQSPEMTYVFAMTRIQAGGVETLRDVVCFCCARFPSTLGRSASSSSSSSAQRIWTRKPLPSRSAPCMPLPRNGNDKCSGDDPAFLCHVPAAAFVLIRPLFARVDEITSAKWQLWFDLTSPYWTSNRVWPCLAACVSRCTATNPQARSARVGQARATRVHVLTYVG